MFQLKSDKEKIWHLNLDKKIRLIINIMGFLIFSKKEDLMGRYLKKDEWLEVFNLYEQYINYDITKKNLCLNIYKWQRKILFIEIQLFV